MPLAFMTGCGARIHDLAANGEIEAVEALLAKDPSLIESANTQGKARGKTPLHYAVTYGQRDAAVLLLDKGANVNAADDTGYTALHMAASLGYIEGAELLLDRGAALEARDAFGDTPLHVAAIFNQAACVLFLIEAGADTDARNGEGLTPLDLARRQRNEAAIEALEPSPAANAKAAG
jgi:ankyrin repeat protein